MSPYSILTLEIRLAYSGEADEDMTAALSDLERGGEILAELLVKPWDELSVLTAKVKP